MHIVEKTTAYKENELYTKVCVDDYEIFFSLLTILKYNGNDISFIIKESDRLIEKNNFFYFYYNSKIWLCTDIMPNNRFCAINDYENFFYIWADNDQKEDIKDIIKLMLKNIFDDYHLKTPSFYLKVSIDDVIEDNTHGGLFISLYEDWKENMKVKDYADFNRKIVLELREIMSIFGVKAIELYSNLQRRDDIDVYIKR